MLSRVLLSFPLAAVPAGAQGEPAKPLSGRAADLIATSEAGAIELQERFQRALDAISEAPAAFGRLVDWALSPGQGPSRFIALVATAGLMIVLGYVLEALVGRITGPARTPPAALRRWALSSAAFILGAAALPAFVGLPSNARRTAIAIFAAWAFVHVVAAAAEGVLQRFAGEPGRSAMAWVRVALALAAAGYVLIGLMRLAGEDHAVTLVFGYAFWLAFLAAAAMLLVTLQRSPALQDRAAAAAGPNADPATRFLARHWPAFYAGVLVLFGAGGMIAAAEQESGAFLSALSSVLVLAAMPAVMALWPRSAALRSSLRLMTFAGAWALVAWIWGVDLLGSAEARLGERVVRVLIDTGVAVALAAIVWEIARTALERYAAPKMAALGAEGAAGAVATRIQTFLPLVRATLLAIIVAVTVMIALASAGVEIGPLLAGAGIAGVAIGFGAQTLVRDIISGIFFLSDDAFRIGEYVEIGEAQGTVEDMSVRSLRLRHPRGAVFTVPFGEIRQIKNLSRDYAILKLDFLLAFDTDLAKAKKVVKEVGKALEADPGIGGLMLQPVKFQGVRRMEQHGMVVSVKVTARPGQQWTLRREVFQRVRDAFAREGIAFGRPQVTVQVPPAAAPPEAAGAAFAAGLDGAGAFGASA